jgi:hypothetical protein
MREATRRLPFWLVASLISFTGLSAPADLPRAAIADIIAEMRAAQTDAARLRQHEQLKSVWRDYLADASVEEALHFDPQYLSTLMGIVSGGKDEHEIRVLSWNVELADRSHRYGGFIITSDGWTELSQDERLDLDDGQDTQRRYKPEDWPGAIYYDIVVRAHKRNTTYLLLGWQGVDATTTRKVIESLDINRGRIRFGAPVLEVNGRRVKRHHLIYGDAVSAALRHEPDANRIVMDHLSPPSPELEGLYAFYGPDFSYDAFVWQKDVWILEQDVKVADPNITKPWIDPKPRKRRKAGRN